MLGAGVRRTRGVALELAWQTAHLALYPLGMLADEVAHHKAHLTPAGLPPVQRALLAADVVAATTPIVLVHGMVDNRSVFTVLRRDLLRRGFHCVASVNYSPFLGDVRDAAAVLADGVTAVRAQTGCAQVHLVAHSLGGLVARYYLQHLGGSEHVHTLVTLGTPHGGTTTARLAPGYGLAAQLRPGSDLLTELDAPAPGCRSRVLAFWSDWDHVIAPRVSAQFHHPDIPGRNVLAAGVGHLSLPVSRCVLAEIARTLGRLDPRDGELALQVGPRGGTAGPNPQSFSTGA